MCMIINLFICISVVAVFMVMQDVFSWILEVTDRFGFEFW